MQSCKTGSQEEKITKDSLKVKLVCTSGSCISYSILHTKEKTWFHFASIKDPTICYVFMQKRWGDTQDHGAPTVNRFVIALTVNKWCPVSGILTLFFPFFYHCHNETHYTLLPNAHNASLFFLSWEAMFSSQVIFHCKTKHSRKNGWKLASCSVTNW